MRVGAKPFSHTRDGFHEGLAEDTNDDDMGERGGSRVDPNEPAVPMVAEPL